VASFVGFVPAERPRIAIAVVLDEPMGGMYAGGSVAAPVFRRVGEMALRYLGVTPRGSTPMKLSEIAAQAGGDLAESTYEVLSQARAAGAPAPSAAVTPSAPLKTGEVRMPDLSGLPAREAVKSVVALGLWASVEGTGRIARQEPPPGSVLAKGSTVKLVFEPPS
jgi:cell division protein FtsI (penicillin-binding protein 3)